MTPSCFRLAILAYFKTQALRLTNSSIMYMDVYLGSTTTIHLYSSMYIGL